MMNEGQVSDSCTFRVLGDALQAHVHLAGKCDSQAVGALGGALYCMTYWRAHEVHVPGMPRRACRALVRDGPVDLM